MINASIVIPIYGKTKIEHMLEEYRKKLKKERINYEIIVVSEEGKRRNVERLKSKKIKIIWNKKRLGKGAAIKLGILESKHNIVGFVDGDFSIPPKELVRAIKETKKNSNFIGVRNSVKRSRLRNLLSEIFNSYVRLITGIKLKDTQCGLKFFTRSEITKIVKKSKIDGFAFDVEILHKLKKINAKNIDWVDRFQSTVSIFSIIRMGIDVLRIRFFH